MSSTSFSFRIFGGRRMLINRNAAAYAATTLASSLMNSVFFFYYVKLFLDFYKVPNPWFQFAQVGKNLITHAKNLYFQVMWWFKLL